MEKKRKKVFSGFLAALIILFLIIYAFPNVTGALKKTEIIEYGGIQVVDQVTAYFVRDEMVYLANKTGSINYYVEEGEQVRKGVKILDLALGKAGDQESSYKKIVDRIERFNGGESLFSDDIKRINTQIKKIKNKKETATAEGDKELAAKYESQITRLQKKKEYIKATDKSAKEEILSQQSAIAGTGMVPDQYISQTNGVVSYYIDGYESEFTPENMALLTKDKVEKLTFDVQNLARKNTLTNEPLFKLVDNKEWYAVFWVEPQNIVKYQKNKTAYLNLPLGQVEGTIYDIIDDNGEWLVILKFNRYYDEFAKLRKIDTEVVTSDYKGLTIRNESITTKGGQPGVYVKDKSGQYVFKPVKIITSDGEWSLVEVSYFYSKDGSEKVETVNTYDEILKRPNQR